MSVKPNILFFLADQHRADWLGCASVLPVRTPNLDRLAAGGVRFSQALCPSPLCAPSRASLASGRSYPRCGVVDNSCNYPLDQPTYYQALRAQGYRVAGVGKFDLHKDTRDPAALWWGLDGSHCLRDWGFSEGIDNEGKLDGSASYRAAGGPRGPYLAFLEQRSLADLYVREHAERRQHMDAYTTALPDDAYCDNWLAENGLRFLREFPRELPWHLVVNFTGPHNPMDVTQRMRERWENVPFAPPHGNSHPDRKGLLRTQQNYAAMIETIDRQVGRFLDVVRERGDLERTLIVYASDHGEMLGEHGLWGKGIWRHPACAIPLIVAGPGIVRGMVSPALVSLHDLAATFIDYAHAEPLPGMDAASLRPVLSGARQTQRRVITAGLNDWRLAYDGRWKLVVQGAGAPMLYDLSADPREEHDVAATYEDVVRRLHSALPALPGSRDMAGE